MEIKGAEFWSQGKENVFSQCPRLLPIAVINITKINLGRKGFIIVQVTVHHIKQPWTNYPELTLPMVG